MIDAASAHRASGRWAGADAAQFEPDPARFEPDPAQFEPDPARFEPDPAQFEPDPARFEPNAQFEPDPGERLEALATTGKGPVRLAARAVVALGAHAGRWQRNGQARGSALAEGAGDATTPAGAPGPVPARSALVPLAPPTPTRAEAPAPVRRRSRSAALLDGPLLQRRHLQEANVSPTPASPVSPAVDVPAVDVPAVDVPASPSSVALPSRVPRARPLQARRDRPIRPDTSRPPADPTGGRAAPAARRLRPTPGAPRSAQAPAPFPAELAERRAGGVCDDAAWDRWAASGSIEGFAPSTADLDRAPSRAQRAEDHLQRAAQRIAAGPRHLAEVLTRGGRRATEPATRLRTGLSPRPPRALVPGGAGGPQPTMAAPSGSAAPSVSR